MGEREAFGPNLRRIRVQRNISLDDIAAATKVSVDLWSGLERNDFSRWPSGIYARAYIRAYAIEIGVDPDATVDEFCRSFPQGDRRAARVVKEQAAIVGHQLRWKDDLKPAIGRDRRAQRDDDDEVPVFAFTRSGRVVAAIADLTVVASVTAAISSLAPLGWARSLGIAAVAYYTGSLVALGCSPSVWVLDTYLANRKPSVHRAGAPRILRLLRSPRA
jgi:transcriptional regulator with XRE-family HTH domain